MVHIAATLGNLLLSYAILVAVNPGFPSNWAFFVVGFEGTLTYNLMLLLEDGFARFVMSVFDKWSAGT